MLSDRCLPVLSCLSVCNVGVLWPNGLTHQDETWHAGRTRPWPHCVRWGPSSPSPKGHSPPQPNCISIGSAVFAQMTAECPYTLQWDAPFPLKLAAFHGDLDLHLTRGSVGPPGSSFQTASRSVQPFLQSSLV